MWVNSFVSLTGRCRMASSTLVGCSRLPAKEKLARRCARHVSDAVAAALYGSSGKAAEAAAACSGVKHDTPSTALGW